MLSKSQTLVFQEKFQLHNDASSHIENLIFCFMWFSLAADSANEKPS